MGASLWILANPPPTYRFVSLNFCSKISEPEPGILGFGRARVPGERAEGKEKKAVGKKRAKEYPSWHTGKFARYLTGTHSFHWPDFWHKE